MIKSVYLGIAAATMTIALTAGPLMADEVERGKIIAQDLCSHCHVMGSEPAEAPRPLPFAQQEPPFPEAQLPPSFPEAQLPPSFPQLAIKIPLNEDYIHTTLRNPHPNMVKYSRITLTTPMVSDLVAYLRSLKLKADQAKEKADQVELEADQAANGLRQAQRWCSNCHVVASEEAPAGPKAPTFPQVANRILLSESYLDFWLRNPNPPMHTFELSEPMVSNIVAYLRSLKK